jgi:3-hydroxyisobutyrate dehydrogenase-like beta-hydroxyacid dehydrogenase
MKLFMNMMLYGSIQVISEVYALADATDFPVDKLHDAFRKYLPLDIRSIH